MQKVIAIDFDGTLCENKYPEIGLPRWGVIFKALSEQENGAALILWTCRTGKELNDAVDACAKWGLTFDAVKKTCRRGLTHGTMIHARLEPQNTGTTAQRAQPMQRTLEN